MKININKNALGFPDLNEHVPCLKHHAKNYLYMGKLRTASYDISKSSTKKQPKKIIHYDKIW